MAEAITWLDVPDDEEVPEEVRALWAKPLEKLGFVPNVLRVMALRPDHLLGWWAYYDELMRGESALTKTQREMIAVVVSAQNRCHYCVVSHSAALRKLTEDPPLVDRLATNYKYAEVTDAERAMLDYAVKLTVDSVLVLGGRYRGAARRGLGRPGHPRHRTGSGDVQLHEPARERARLAPQPRVLLDRTVGQGS